MKIFKALASVGVVSSSLFPLAIISGSKLSVPLSKEQVKTNEQAVVSRLNKEIDKLEKMIDLKSKEINRLVDKIETDKKLYKRFINELEARSERAYKKLRTKKNYSIEILNLEMATLQKEYQTTIKNLNILKQKHIKKITELKKMVTGLQQQIFDLRAENSKLKAKYKDETQIKSELAYELDVDKYSFYELSKKNSQLRADVKKYKDSSEIRAGLVLEFSGKNDKLETQIKKLQEQVENKNIKRLETQIKRLETQIKELWEQLKTNQKNFLQKTSELRAENSKLKAELHKYEDQSQTITKQSQKIIELNNKIKKLRADVENQKHISKVRSDIVFEISGENNDLKNQIKKLQEQLKNKQNGKVENFV